jgi:hypothetical protein
MPRTDVEQKKILLSMDATFPSKNIQLKVPIRQDIPKLHIG